MKNYLLTTVIILQAACLSGQVRDPLDDGRVIKVPVVFHIIYNNQGENVADSLILTELRDLNLDFTAKNDMSLLDNDFRTAVGNPNIQFYLLDRAFHENGLKGVRRVPARQAGNRTELLVNAENCVNIFVARQGNATGNDRINLSYQDVGAHSSALTHETGHWMGLFHIFGKIGNSSWLNVTFHKNDDSIDDTPEQKGATAICYEIKPDCPCPPTDLYYKGHKRMYNNFMDYNPCRCMFTVGQATQMRNYIIKEMRTVFENSN